LKRVERDLWVIFGDSPQKPYPLIRFYFGEQLKMIQLRGQVEAVVHCEMCPAEFIHPMEDPNISLNRNSVYPLELRQVMDRAGWLVGASGENAWCTIGFCPDCRG
jgi:hypothetical protein